MQEMMILDLRRQKIKRADDNGKTDNRIIY